LFAALVLLAGARTTGVAAAATVAYFVQTLRFSVLIGPGGVQRCDIVGDLYTPADAGPRRRTR
jgi:hypothetical protein